jgi:hypothetical protein
MKNVIRKASRLIQLSAGLYRELATSAFELVPNRRQA